MIALDHKLHFLSAVTLVHVALAPCAHHHSRELVSIQKEEGSQWFSSLFNKSVHIENQLSQLKLKSQQTQLLRKPQRSFHIDLVVQMSLLLL